jgi:hypothetical protein
VSLGQTEDSNDGDFLEPAGNRRKGYEGIETTAESDGAPGREIVVAIEKDRSVKRKGDRKLSKSGCLSARESSSVSSSGPTVWLVNKYHQIAAS